MQFHTGLAADLRGCRMHRDIDLRDSLPKATHHGAPLLASADRALNAETSWPPPAPGEGRPHRL